MSSYFADSPRRKHMRTLSKILLILFLIVAAALFFWGVIRADAILARNDNPRLVEAEMRIRRGAILDRHGKVLAHNIGSPNSQQRIYPFPISGPAIGFYSLTYGTTGAENGFDALLRGESMTWTESYWQRTLHLPQIGGDVQLAIDIYLQELSHSLMDKQEGVVLLLELSQDGTNRAWIRSLTSLPGYDPNLIDEQFEELATGEQASLLNRVTQGQYQPGLLLQPFILAAALDQEIIALDDSVTAAQRPVEINDKMVSCASPPPEPATWADVLRHQCPGPMQDLADQLGKSGLEAIFAAFELDRDPSLAIDTMTMADDPLLDPLMAGIGQDNLSVTPLNIGLGMAALLNNGSIPQPQLALAISDQEGNWQEQPLEKEPVEVVSSVVAGEVLRALHTQDGLSEISTHVLSRPEDNINAWYIGMSTSQAADYVVVVVLEGSNQISLAQHVGRGVISAANELQSGSAGEIPSPTTRK